MKRPLSAPFPPGPFARSGQPAPEPRIGSIRRRRKARQTDAPTGLHEPHDGHRFQARAVAVAIVVALLVFPLAVYWPTIHARYGFRDDYSILREAHEVPEKVVQVSTMQARPIDGWLLATSFRRIESIEDLPRMRLTSALLFGVVAADVFLLLMALKWDRWTAAMIAAVFSVLPATQIVVAWAVGWPLPLALLLSLAAFVVARRTIAGGRTRRSLVRGDATAVRPGHAFRLGWWVLAVGLLAASALVYQSNACLYVSLIGAAIWRRRRWRCRRGVEWFVRHAVTAAAALLLAFGVAVALFATGAAPVSQRVAFEHDWTGKLRWFAEEPLQNALALIALNHDGGSLIAHRVAMLVGVVIVAGCLRSWQAHGWRRGAWWPTAFALVVLGSFSANLIVADRWSVYRVLAPVSVTVLFALAMALLALGGRWLARLGLLALLVPGAWLARRQTLELIAQPQGAELAAIEAGADRIDPERSPRVFVVTPRPTEHLVPVAFADEFGSLSTDSSWVTKEMLNLVMRERYPGLTNVSQRYTFEAGHDLPPDFRPEVVIDLRHTLRFQAATDTSIR